METYSFVHVHVYMCIASLIYIHVHIHALSWENSIVRRVEMSPPSCTAGKLSIFTDCHMYMYAANVNTCTLYLYVMDGLTSPSTSSFMDNSVSSVSIFCGSEITAVIHVHVAYRL